MPSPPLGAGFVEILLMHRIARLHLLPQISADASQFLVRHGLPIALRAARFVRPFDRGLARGCEKVNGAAVAHSFYLSPNRSMGKAVRADPDGLGVTPATAAF